MRPVLPPLFAAVALFMATPLAAQDALQITLGGDRLGQLTHTLSRDTRDLGLLLDSTPFGVFDGSYSGRTVTSDGVARHSGRTRSSRKSRDLSMRTDTGQLREVSLLPEEERTALTAPEAVTGTVLDPVSGFGRLIEAKACPDGLRIYDGRRIGLLSLAEERRDADEVICRATFRVVEGPGYLEPLGISNLSVELRYEVTEPGWQLKRVGARSGPFNLVIVR